MNKGRTQSVCIVRRGFTLLEAVIALAFMAMILVASLELRMQSMRVGADIGKTCRASRPMEALNTMLINRALPAPERDEVTGQSVWRGDYLDHPYIITRTREEVSNPVGSLDSGDDVPALIGVWRYTIAYQGEEETFLWHR